MTCLCTRCSRLKKDFQPFACGAARQPLPLARREGTTTVSIGSSQHRTRIHSSVANDAQMPSSLANDAQMLNLLPPETAHPACRHP